MFAFRFQHSLSVKKFVFLSLLLHAAIFSLILWMPHFAFKKKDVKVVWVVIPRGASEELDIKIKESEDLPKTTIQEQKKLVQEEEKKEEPKEKPLVQPKVEEKPKPALRPIQPEPKPPPKKLVKKVADWQKALAALEKKKVAPPEAAQTKEKGEGFKYGTGSEPLRVPPSDPEYVAYQAKVRYKIIQEWVLPLSYLEGSAPPKAMIAVFINQEGVITSQEWENRSGNTAFDSSCARAVQRASPLPIPPERLGWEAYNEGFLIEFDPTLKQQ